MFAATPARPTELLVVGGDSLTQGFAVDSMADQWPFLLAKDINYRCINHGYGGRGLVGADGSTYGAEGGDITTMFILANDVSQGTPLATVTSRLNAFWATFFGARPAGNNAKLLMISQPGMENGDGGVPSAIPGAQYRTTMQNAVAAAVSTYPNLRYKNGAELSDGAGDWTDGTHFKSAASPERVYPRLKAHLQTLGWTVAPFNFTGGAMPTGATLARTAGPVSRVNAAGVIEITTAANTARFDYAPVSKALRGLLVERASTNRILSSDALDAAAWAKNGVTIATGLADPAGGTAADALVEDASNGLHYAYQSNVTGAGATSVYAKMVDRRWIALYSTSVGTAVAFFDLSNGAVGQIIGSGITASITDAGNGWRRCTLVDATAGSHAVGALLASANGTTSYVGTAGSRSTFYGFQNESALSSYIPIGSAAITRGADVLTLDWGSRGVPDGNITARYTFDDNSTQDVATVVANGKSTVAGGTLNQFCIRRVEMVGA